MADDIEPSDAKPAESSTLLNYSGPTPEHRKRPDRTWFDLYLPLASLAAVGLGILVIWICSVLLPASTLGMAISAVIGLPPIILGIGGFGYWGLSSDEIDTHF
jgi:hypothetical protein